MQASSSSTLCHSVNHSLAWSWLWGVQADDLCDVAAFARQQHTAAGRPAVPWFIGGFSLGGLTAVHAVLRPEQQGGLWRGLVLVSACMWVKMTLLTRVQRLVGPLLNYAMPKAQIVQRLDPLHELHPDPHEVRGAHGVGVLDAAAGCWLLAADGQLHSVQPLAGRTLAICTMPRCD